MSSLLIAIALITGLLLVAAARPRLFAKAKLARPTSRATLDSDRWTLAQGEFEGHPLLIRYREFVPGHRRAAFPERLNIFWTMTEPDRHGLTTTAEFDRLSTFENRLVEAVERDGLAVLSVVLTCNGKREFVFHTADVAGFSQRLHDMPQEHDRYPIEIVHARDAMWAYDDSVVPGTR